MFVHSVRICTHLPYIFATPHLAFFIGYRFRIGVDTLTYRRIRILRFTRSAASISCRRYLFDRFLNCLVIEVISRRFCEQKDVFITLCRPVLDRFGERIYLVPDDVRAKIPAALSERPIRSLGLMFSHLFGIENTLLSLS